jgi:hypothetical protein
MLARSDIGASKARPRPSSANGSGVHIWNEVQRLNSIGSVSEPTFPPKNNENNELTGGTATA